MALITGEGEGEGELELRSDKGRFSSESGVIGKWSELGDRGKRDGRVGSVSKCPKLGDVSRESGTKMEVVGEAPGVFRRT